MPILPLSRIAEDVDHLEVEMILICNPMYLANADSFLKLLRNALCSPASFGNLAKHFIPGFV